MFSQFGKLDEFLVDRLVRPFYWLGMGFAALVLLVGWLVGLLALLRTPTVGLLTLVAVTLLAVLLAVAVRLAAESVIALFRIHKRFVGGDPKDPVPS